MFYEETIIQGKLHCRTSPQGKWQPLSTPRALALNALLALSEEDRQSVLRYVVPA